MQSLDQGSPSKTCLVLDALERSTVALHPGNTGLMSKRDRSQSLQGPAHTDGSTVALSDL